tara:strand:- start:616 stop:942 length:327 start_codon:yes stop_codon:yes gene_type:complete
MVFAEFKFRYKDFYEYISMRSNLFSLVKGLPHYVSHSVQIHTSWGAHLRWQRHLEKHIMSIDSLFEINHFENILLKRKYQLMNISNEKTSTIDPVDFEEFKHKYNSIE